ncbi:hypothetical protein ACH5RR_017528 [Cinchona calisaya]|uniref:Uncharacterized protein n=1 Tax=Cinchona calisaya TaxID=153742 RepID=A0ABD2ZJS2_9GENT
MELVVHSSEHSAAENPSMTLIPGDVEQFSFDQCPLSPLAALLIFPSDTALIDQTAKFSSHSSPAVSNPAVDQNLKSTKRKEREVLGKWWLGGGGIVDLGCKVEMENWYVAGNTEGKGMGEGGAEVVEVKWSRVVGK